MAIQIPRPLAHLLDLQQAMDRSRKNNWAGTTGRGAYPLINAFEADDGVVVVAELAGVKKDDVTITVERNQLRIQGKKQIDYGEGVSLHRRERSQGTFDRTFSLPFQIDRDQVQANFRDGLLALRIPRAASDQPRTIQIA